MSESKGTDSGNMTPWSNVIDSVRSPIKFFTLVMLVCHAIFAICATILEAPMLVVYCMHMFVAMVSFMFIATLWCPSALYHPSELSSEQNNNVKNSPMIPTIFGMVGLVLYLIYQSFVVYSGGHPYIKPTRWQSAGVESIESVNSREVIEKE